MQFVICLALTRLFSRNHKKGSLFLALQICEERWSSLLLNKLALNVLSLILNSGGVPLVWFHGGPAFTLISLCLLLVASVK